MWDKCDFIFQWKQFHNSLKLTFELDHFLNLSKISFYYISVVVLKASKQDFMALGNIQKNSNDDYVLRLEGLPWNSKENEIQHFFHGMNFLLHLFEYKNT